MNGFNWFWIAMAATVPFPAALLVAWPLWRARQPILGNIAGTAVLFAAGFAAIFREHIELDRIVQACLDGGTVCWPEPSAFTRFALYASIAMIEVFALFSLSLKVEDRIRRRDYAPQWR